jgi:tetratricopeptide (TPR) repeat protein
MNHEFWNEIGNLYFMCGAYEPAIHAYLRSIKLESTFGRSYSNLAMVYVETGKYRDAIKLYRRSIELISDEKEKALTWNRLGILYRQIKEYNNALEAYQRADLIAPLGDSVKSPEARMDTKIPLTIPMPEIDLDAILAKGHVPKFLSQNDLIAEINAEFEMVELRCQTPGVEDEVVPPEFENFSQPEDIVFKSTVSAPSEWKLAYAEDVPPIDMSTPSEQETKADEPEQMDIIVPVEIQNAVLVDLAPEDAPVVVPQLESSAVSETHLVEDANLVKDSDCFENSSQPEFAETTASETAAESTQYSQMEYPLTELSPAEQQMLELEILKYQQSTSSNPRSYILWEGLGEAYKSAGQYKNAIQAFQKAIALNPSNPMCHYRLGLVYAAEHRNQDAIRLFEKVLELDPRSAQAHASLASQYRKMGMEEAAQKHIEKVRITQFEGESDYNRACLEAICGNGERALNLLEVALQTKQTYVTWAQNDPDFESLRGDHRFQTLLAAHATVE